MPENRALAYIDDIARCIVYGGARRDGRAVESLIEFARREYGAPGSGYLAGPETDGDVHMDCAKGAE